MDKPTTFKLTHFYVGEEENHSVWYWFGVSFHSDWHNNDKDEAQIRDACAWLDQQDIPYFFTEQSKEIGTMHNGQMGLDVTIYLRIPDPNHGMLFKTFNSYFKQVEIDVL
ncbi:MAG: hypothetical protein EOP83_05395 [Verrucomicrobiaceae bacterium]|nr:MAG: hypothetical protein EOP83_05395 [Verrucomicrobiaceae bacterium]